MNDLHIFGHTVYGGAAYGILIVALFFIALGLYGVLEARAMRRSERASRHKEARTYPRRGY